MIYFVRCGRTEFVKIGTAKNVVGRLNDLQLSNPLPLTLLAVAEGGWFIISARLRAFTTS